MGSTNIPIISQPVLDPKTGLMTREWYRFFRDPIFATIGVGGVIGVGSGGTGLGSGTSGGVLAFTGTTTIGSSALLALNGPVLGGGAGGTPTSMAAGTDGQLVVGQTATAPAWKAVSGDATLSNTGALTIANAAITYAKIQNVSATSRVLGRKTAGAGVVEELAASDVRSILRTGQGAAVASANNLTLGTDGNYFQITGAVQINLLDNSSWAGGSVVILKFNGAPTVKHNQGASGNFKPIILNGAVDFVAAANNTLTLVYDSTDGVWYETGRKV